MAAKTKLNRLTITEVSVCDKGANPDAYMVIAKTKEIAEQPLEATDPETATSVVANTLEDTDMPFDLTSLPEEFRKSVGDYLTTLEAEHTAEVTKLKAAAPAPVETPAPVEVPTEVAKKLLDQSTEIAKLRAAMEARDESEAIAKARVELSAFDAGDVEVIAKGLLKLSRVDADLASTVQKALNSAQAIAKRNASLMAETGANTNKGDADAFAKVETLAKKMVESDPKMSLDVAIAKVLETHPQLYTEYLAEIS